MKKLLLYLILACFVSNADAQFARLFPKKKKKTETTETTEKTKNYPLFLSLGIEPPSDNGPRTKGHYSGKDFYVDNKDATRFLEKAVQEDSVAKVEKLLKVGASAFVNYEMIDKKQYEIMDAMYRDNPKIIKYSQLLHYACAKSDTTMIDFLIQRGASLDLCGFCEEKGGRGYFGFDLERRDWNGDVDYKYTPADVALDYRQWDNLRHIALKYHKYPTIYGCGRDWYFMLKGMLPTEQAVKYRNAYLNGEYQYFWLNNVDYTIADAINFGFHQYEKSGDKMFPKSYYPINAIVSKIAESRKQDANGGKEYVDMLNLMLEKGASVSVESDNGAYHRYVQSTIGMGYLQGYTNTTPMTIAVTNKNMMDIIQLLRSKGAPMTTMVNGRKVSVLQVPGALDEYKEYFMLEGQ